MKTIISTVGTSIFENFFQLPENSSHKAASNYSHLKKNNYAYAEWDSHKTRIEALEKINWKKSKTSAEIASIIAIQAELGKEVEVYLLATDTILSVLAAELIQQWFEDESNKERYPGITKLAFERPDSGFENNDTENHVIKYLRIDKQENYENGMMALLKVLNRITAEDAILNITGGYKSIVPIMTIWAQINKVVVKYLFNEGELAANVKPLTMESLPIHFDWEFIETVAYALNENVLMNLKSENEQDEKLLELLHKNKLITNDRSLTALGVVVQQYLSQDGQPTANNILGLFVEYKLFKFFSTSEYKGIKYQPEKTSLFRNPDGMLTDQRNEENEGNGYCEIDLFLRRPDGSFVIGEIKAYNQTGDKTIKELEEKERKYKEFNPDDEAKELWLIVVSASLKTSLGEWYQNSSNPKLNVLQRGRKKIGPRFRAFSYQFNLSSGKLAKGVTAVNTASLLRREIQEDELIEIEIE